MSLNRANLNRISLKRFSVPGTGGGGAAPVPLGPLYADFLIISGGGGGGGPSGGGGGAGGLRQIYGYPVTSQNSYTIVIGSGGGTGANGTNSGIYNATISFWTTGGGAGGIAIEPAAPAPLANGRSGGCGGGAARGYIPSFGMSGGTGNLQGLNPPEGYAGGASLGGVPAPSWNNKYTAGGGGGVTGIGGVGTGGGSPGLGYDQGPGGFGGTGMFLSFDGANTG